MRNDPSPSPFFSVVIPTYNRAELLRQAVQSVLDQTFDNFELIIVDDGSSDTTSEVVAEFDDHRISFVLNDHGKGGAGTRNAGIIRSRGEWVAFLDDDDMWLPEKLERQYQKIQAADKDVGLVYSGHVKFKPDTCQITYTFVPQHEGWLYEHLLYKNVIGGLYSVVIKRGILEEVGSLDERFPALQDADLYVRVAKLCKVAFVKEPLVRVRKSETGRITTNYDSKLRGNQLFWKKFEVDIGKDKRLTHRAASRVFMFAFAQGDLRALAQSAPWTLAGFAFDRENITHVARFIARESIKKLTRGRV